VRHPFPCALGNFVVLILSGRLHSRDLVNIADKRPLDALCLGGVKQRRAHDVLFLPLSERGFRSMSVRSPPLFLSERLRPRQFLYPASTNFAASTMFQSPPFRARRFAGKRSQMGMAPSTVP
jgi:hypothetical protein